jgi:2',3'-cyclic-nucleotide 2'-phosphodiesterase (5'-nucleotidase family)
MPVQENQPFLVPRNYLYWYILVAVPFVCLAAVLAYLWLHRCGECRAQQSQRQLTFITVNDVYQLDGVAGGIKGGLNRLRTLRTWIERDAPNAILLHAGDFLAPSLTSKVFKGEHMIDVLNHMDGDGAAFDKRMFVVFGNHEFDDSRCDTENAVLNKRVADSQFTWLNANLDFSGCSGMKSLATQSKVVRDGVVLDVNGIKLGLFGIGLTPGKMNGEPASDKYPVYQDEGEAARRSIKYLRDNGAEFVVGVTHLPWQDDQNLIATLGSNGLDLIVGGHDHSNMVLRDKDQLARAFKADADARTVWRIDVDMSVPGKPVVRPQLISLNEAIPPDPDVQKRSQSWSDRAEAAICDKVRHSNDPLCLWEVVGSTQTPIDLEESDSRTDETAFGDWLADLLIEKTGADVGIVNSGSLGLDDELPPGRLQVRTIVDIFRYDDIVAVRAFPAKMVCAGLRRGFSTPGSGAWPHVGGVQVDILKAKQYAVTVRSFTKKPQLDCDSDETIKVASVPFVLCGNDGYPFKPRDTVPPGKKCEDMLKDNPLDEPTENKRPGTTLSRMAEQAIRAAGDTGIAPRKDGRIRFTNPASAK